MTIEYMVVLHTPYLVHGLVMGHRLVRWGVYRRFQVINKRVVEG